MCNTGIHQYQRNLKLRKCYQSYTPKSYIEVIKVNGFHNIKELVMIVKYQNAKMLIITVMTYSTIVLQAENFR